MFREALERTENLIELDNKQLSNFDEKIIDRLRNFENNIPQKVDRLQYHSVLDGLQTSILHQLELECAILTDSEDQQRLRDLKEQHNIASYLIQLGELLSRQGISVSWYDQPHHHLATDREKILARIIAEREALVEVWPYLNKQKKIDKQNYNKEQIITIKNIVKEFGRLPEDTKQEMIKLATDDSFLKEQIAKVNQQFKSQESKMIEIN